MSEKLDRIVEQLAGIEERVKRIDEMQVSVNEQLAEIRTRQREDGMHFGAYLVDILRAVRDVERQIDASKLLERFEERLAAIKVELGGTGK